MAALGAVVAVVNIGVVVIASGAVYLVVPDDVLNLFLDVDADTVRDRPRRLVRYFRLTLVGEGEHRREGQFRDVRDAAGLWECCAELCDCYQGTERRKTQQVHERTSALRAGDAYLSA